MTFKEYQALATRVPVSLRNNRDRIELPIQGLQEEIGRIGSLFAAPPATGRFNSTAEQRGELKDRFSDILWFMALLCHESGLEMQEVALHGAAILEARAKNLHPDER